MLPMQRAGVWTKIPHAVGGQETQNFWLWEVPEGLALGFQGHTAVACDQFLIRELESCKLWGTAKEKEKEKRKPFVINSTFIFASL